MEKWDISNTSKDIIIKFISNKASFYGGFVVKIILTILCVMCYNTLKAFKTRLLGDWNNPEPVLRHTSELLGSYTGERMDFLLALGFFILGILELFRWSGKVVRGGDDLRIYFAIFMIFISLIYMFLRVVYALAKDNARQTRYIRPKIQVRKLPKPVKTTDLNKPPVFF